MNSRLMPLSPRRPRYHQDLNKSGVGNRLPPIVTAMVITSKGIAVFSDEKKLKTVFAEMMSWWLLTFGPGVVIPGGVFLVRPGLVPFQVGHDVH
jgi:hypothetical protein